MSAKSARTHEVRYVGGFVLLSLLLLIPNSAIADWEQLPDPPARFPLPSWTFEDLDELSVWKSFPAIPILNDPIMVAGPNGKIYMGYSILELGSYDRWIEYDTETEVYSNRTSMNSTLDFMVYFPIDLRGSATFVDDRIIVGGDYQNRLAEYDIQFDSWTWSDITLNADYPYITLGSDESNEILYWYKEVTTAGRADPDIGPASKETGRTILDYYNFIHYTGVGVRDNTIYVAGGYYDDGAKGIPWFSGESSAEATIYNFSTRQSEAMADMPVPQKISGTAWGSDSLHFVGSSLNMFEFLPELRFFNYLSRYSKHLSYNPTTDTWLDHDDMPLDCLPFAACGQGGWLYGLFVCPGTDEQQLHLYRTYIGNWGTSTSTTTTTTTTTIPPADDDTDDDTGDDDAGNDDLADDDLQASDDDSDASADDDDDAGGCGG